MTGGAGETGGGCEVGSGGGGGMGTFPVASIVDCGEIVNLSRQKKHFSTGSLGTLVHWQTNGHYNLALANSNLDFLFTLSPISGSLSITNGLLSKISPPVSTPGLDTLYFYFECEQQSGTH